MSNDENPAITSDTSQIDEKPLARKPFPGGKPYRIHICREAYDAVWKHAREAPFDYEVGGMLIGEVCCDPQGPFLDIRAAIAAEHTKNEDTQLTFTPESWIQVNAVKDELYPDLVIVGWYHTHPRFGIFLSDRDQFIQSTSFAQPWTTALVIDPVQNLEGFFFWQGGQPRLAPEYWVGTERRDRSSAQLEDAPEDHEMKRPPLMPSSPVSRAVFVFTVALAAVALGGLFFYVYMLGVGHAEAEQGIVRELLKQEIVLTQQKQMLDYEDQEIKAQQNGLQMTMQQVRQIAAGQAASQQQLAVVERNLQTLSQMAADLQMQIEAQQKVFNPPPPAQPAAGPKQPAAGANSPAQQEKK